MRQRIQILIVDDHPKQLENTVIILQEGIPKFAENIHVLTYLDPEKAITDIKAGIIKPDIVLLDVEMPAMTGFEFVDKCGYNHLHSEPYIILITAHEIVTYYKEATHRRLVYLVKGEEVERFLVERINDYFSFLTITHYNNGRFTPYRISEICYIEGNGDVSKLFLKGTTYKPVIGKSLAELEREEHLSTKGFIRIHDSYVVNPKNIQKYVAGERGAFSFEALISEDENTVPIGRTYRNEDHPEVLKLIDHLKGRR